MNQSISEIACGNCGLPPVQSCLGFAKKDFFWLELLYTTCKIKCQNLISDKKCSPRLSKIDKTQQKTRATTKQYQNVHF